MSIVEQARTTILDHARTADEPPVELRFSPDGMRQFLAEVEPWLIAHAPNIRDSFMGVPISICRQDRPLIVIPTKRYEQIKSGRTASLRDLTP